MVLLNAARLTASSLLFAAAPPYPGAWPAPGTSLTSSISVEVGLLCRLINVTGEDDVVLDTKLLKSHFRETDSY